MIFDDYRLLPVNVAVNAFVQCFEDQCEVIHNEYQLIVRKRGGMTSQ